MSKKEGSFKPLIFVMIFSLFIAGFWNSFPPLKNAVHAALDPTAGFLLNYNINIGLLIIIFIIAVFTTLVQKYGTDQETLRELKKEQKLLQEESKKYRDHPEKLMEFNKKQMEFFPKTMKLTMRPIIYTSIPFILFFRWFSDYFGALTDVKIFGYFQSWFWAYFWSYMLFSSILRKVLKVV